jgi:hypothetical protein
LDIYNDASRASKVWLTYTTTQTITAPGTAWVQFHVKGLNGIGFGESRTRVEARFPAVVDDATYVADGATHKKIATEAAYFIRNESGLT